MYELLLLGLLAKVNVAHVLISLNLIFFYGFMGCVDACVKGKMVLRRCLKLHFEFFKKKIASFFFNNVSFPCDKSADCCIVEGRFSLSNLHKSVLVS